jgi:hypothetical protein
VNGYARFLIHPARLSERLRACRRATEYMRAMKRTERNWGVPVHVQMATIHQESQFVGDARTPLRYALGVIPMGRQSRPMATARRWTAPGTNTAAHRQPRARRDDIRDATDFMGWYMNLTREGTERHPADRCAQPVPGLSRGPCRLRARQLQRQALADAGRRTGWRTARCTATRSWRAADGNLGVSAPRARADPRTMC